MAFEDSAPIQAGLVTIQDPYFSPIFQHIPYEIDSWFQVPCIPPSVPTMPPSSSFLHSQNHHSPVSSTSSFAISMPTSSHSIQGQPLAADDMFRPTEYQLALDYNRQSTHHEPCQTEAMKQSVHAIISSHFFSLSLSLSLSLSHSLFLSLLHFDGRKLPLTDTMPERGHHQHITKIPNFSRSSGRLQKSTARGRHNGQNFTYLF